MWHDRESSNKPVPPPIGCGYSYVLEPEIGPSRFPLFALSSLPDNMIKRMPDHGGTARPVAYGHMLAALVEAFAGSLKWIDWSHRLRGRTKQICWNSNGWVPRMGVIWP